jgi:hypothetical protein
MFNRRPGSEHRKPSSAPGKSGREVMLSILRKS